MGYFQVRYDSRVIIYDRRGFIRLATGFISSSTNLSRLKFCLIALPSIVETSSASLNE